MGEYMEVIFLGSGSSGNAILMRSQQGCFLVDAGLSAKRLTERLLGCGVKIADLSGIVLTHEHGDHIQGLKVLSKTYQMPLYANAMTAEAIRFNTKMEHGRWNYFTTGGRFSLAGMAIRSFSVPHDASDPVGFLIEYQDVRFAVLTDLGMVTHSVVETIRGVHGVFVETNYDEVLLAADTKRPWTVKQRIASRHGHLSNQAAAQLLVEIATRELRMVILGHLSQDCNTEAHATTVVRAKLHEAGFTEAAVHCAPRASVSQVFRIARSF